MIPERITSAAPCIGGMRAGLELAARYTDRRMAFGKKIRKFQLVSAMLARGITLMDASAGIVYQAALAADRDDPRLRRLASEAKRFVTDNSWEISNLVMQMLGGIGYTNVYPAERALRDARLCQIWTGTNQIMDLMIQHDYYDELLKQIGRYRQSELDAENAAAEEEKIYDDEDMWRVLEKENK